MSDRSLFAFVDPKDPYMAGEVAGEDLPGPILSLLGARSFDNLFLFHTPKMVANAASTEAEVKRVAPGCRVVLHELAIADPKDYSALMGSLGRKVRNIVRASPDSENFICVSSGTAEMRAAWFLLGATRVLPATLLQVGSPAEPLFGSAHVKEVRLDTQDWGSLRDLVMPQQYFDAHSQSQAIFSQDAMRLRTATPPVPAPATIAPKQAPEPIPGLEEALQELGITIGSALLRSSAERAAIAAGSDLPVLLLGETGTGKEVFARLVHRISRRRLLPLVPVNCAAIPKDLVESHLFGHVKGSFTGASGDQKGKFELAHGSTLFLDEIGELPLEAQAKLLRVVQDGVVEPVGSGKPRKVDVRIVAATNRNLRLEIEAGRFREDLYYRLEVVQIRLAPLRERRSEIPMLASALLKQINMRRQRPRQLSKAALQRLEQHDWPGNVRELENVLQRSMLYAAADVLSPEDILITDKDPGRDFLAMLPSPEPGFSLEDFLAQARKRLILRALEKCNGNQSAAADLLGISKQAVSKFLKEPSVNAR